MEPTGRDWVIAAAIGLGAMLGIGPVAAGLSAGLSVMAMTSHYELETETYLTVERALPAGVVLTEADVVEWRLPATMNAEGWAPAVVRARVVGRRTATDVKPGTPLAWNDLCAPEEAAP